MAGTAKVQGPASYFPSIEKKYGQPISHWMQVIQAAGPLRHMELVAHLKTEHGLTRNAVRGTLPGKTFSCGTGERAGPWPPRQEDKKDLRKRTSICQNRGVPSHGCLYLS